MRQNTTEPELTPKSVSTMNDDTHDEFKRQTRVLDTKIFSSVI